MYWLHEMHKGLPDGCHIGAPKLMHTVITVIAVAATYVSIPALSIVLKMQEVKNDTTISISNQTIMQSIANLIGGKLCMQNDKLV